MESVTRQQGRFPTSKQIYCPFHSNPSTHLRQTMDILELDAFQVAPILPSPYAFFKAYTIREKVSH